MSRVIAGPAVEPELRPVLPGDDPKASRDRMALILPSQNLNENTGLFHYGGIALAPSAKPETNSKPLDVFFFGGNLFLGDGRFNQPPER